MWYTHHFTPDGAGGEGIAVLGQGIGGVGEGGKKVEWGVWLEAGISGNSGQRLTHGRRFRKLLDSR